MEMEDILISKEAVLFAKKPTPRTNYGHIDNLTDNTGMIQHAVFSIPNRKEGYCIDDNARALLWAVWACKSDKKDRIANRLLPVYLSFVHYMQTDDGCFRNFMNYDRTSTEERGSEDSFGRTIMALGFLINEATNLSFIRTAQHIFNQACPQIEKLTSLRGIANTIIGVCQMIKFNFPDDLKRDMVINLSDTMIGMYHDNSTVDWKWFEPVLSYDNAMLPLALLNAYEVTQDERYLTIAFEAMHFLESKVFYNDRIKPVGNDGWYRKDGPLPQFDQQGIDVMAMILYYQQAFRITREPLYFSRIEKCYQWFLGSNDLGLSLYDPSTGGCADGLHPGGINLNQGAESTLAYWISHLVANSNASA